MGLMSFIISLNSASVPSIPPVVGDDGLWHDAAYFDDDDGLWHDAAYFDDDDGLWHDEIYF